MLTLFIFANILLTLVAGYHVSFLGHPYPGDLAPMLALAKQLSQNGHKVSVALPEDYRHWLDPEMTFISLGPALYQHEHSKTIAKEGKEFFSQDFSAIFSAAIQGIEAFQTHQNRTLQILIDTYTLDPPDMIFGVPLPFYTCVADLADYFEIQLGTFWTQAEIPYCIMPEIGLQWSTSASTTRFLSAGHGALTFGERLAATGVDAMVWVVHQVQLYFQNQRRRDLFNLPPVKNGYRNSQKFGQLTSLVLINGAPGWTTPSQLSSVTELVGPLVFSGGPRPISPRVSQFLDEHKNVVLVSLGTMSFLGPQVYEDIILGLGGNPTVLLLRGSIKKTLLQSESFKNRCLKHILIVDTWEPQIKILQHPNVGFFISHGGQNAVYEAILEAKPIICLGVQYDQPINCAKLQARGIGVWLPVTTLKPDNLRDAVDEIQKNSTILKKNLMFMKELFDTNEGGRKAVKKIELAIAYGKQYQDVTEPVSIYLAAWQYSMLDVIVFITVVLFIVGYCSFYFWIKLVQKLCKCIS